MMSPEDIKALRRAIIPDGIYHFSGVPGKPNEKGEPTWAFPPAHYRFICVARDYRTFTDKIVYLGLDGPDSGYYYLAGYADWATYFTLAENQDAFSQASEGQDYDPDLAVQ